MRRTGDKITRSINVRTALAAGFVGTAAMTVAMAAMHRLLPPGQDRPLPPYEISMEAAARLGVLDDMDEEGRFNTTIVLHVGYGTAIGALYPWLSRFVPGPSLLKGMGFGTLIWTGSYLGWVPLSGLLSSATRHRAPRNALMIAAHLVWGSVISTMTERMRRGVRRTSNDVSRGFPSPARGASGLPVAH